MIERGVVASAVIDGTGAAPEGTRQQLIRVLRFLVVGGASAGIDIGLLALLHGAVGMPLAWATTLAFWTSLLVNFALNRQWVFTAGDGLHRQAVRYLIAVGLNYLATLGLVTGLAAAGLDYLVAKAIAIVVLACSNYFLYRYWIFR